MQTNNHCLLASALSQFQQHMTENLIAITVELPGYSGIGVTTRAIVARNVALWQAERRQFLRRQNHRKPNES